MSFKSSSFHRVRGLYAALTSFRGNVGVTTERLSIILLQMVAHHHAPGSLALMPAGHLQHRAPRAAGYPLRRSGAFWRSVSTDAISPLIFWGISLELLCWRQRNMWCSSGRVYSSSMFINCISQISKVGHQGGCSGRAQEPLSSVFFFPP